MSKITGKYFCKLSETKTLLFLGSDITEKDNLITLLDKGVKMYELNN